jgi:hypothetical protein
MKGVEHGTRSLLAVAAVENQSISVVMEKTGGALGDEQWEGSVQLTLFAGISAGTYQVDVQADSSNGQTVIDEAAATVTVSQ